MQIVVGKLEGKWIDEEHVNIGVPEVGIGGVDWHEPASNTDKWPVLSDTVIYHGVPQGTMNFMI